MTPPNDVDYKEGRQNHAGGDHSTAEYNGYTYNNSGRLVPALHTHSWSVKARPHYPQLVN